MTRVAYCFYGKIISRCDDMAYALYLLKKQQKNSYIRRLYGRDVQKDVFCHSWHPDLGNQIDEVFCPITSLHEAQKVFELKDIKDPEFSKRVDEDRNMHGGRNPIENQFSSAYSAKKSIELKNTYESANGIKYDFVVLLRYDIIIKEDINIDTLNNNTVYFSNYKPMFKPGLPRIKDFVFISSSENMNEYASLFDYLEEYRNNEDCYRIKRDQLQFDFHRFKCHHIHKTLKIKMKSLDISKEKLYN